MHESNVQRLADQVAIITGGAGGIGLATARTLAAAGARVAIVDIDDQAVEAAARSLGDAGLPIGADVSVPNDIERMVEQTVEAFGKATILVHAATAPRPGSPAVQLPLDDWNAVLSVALTGGFLCAQAMARQIISQGSGGRIINVVSTVVERPRVNSAAYCSAKTGLVGLTRVLAMELAEHGITVNAVGPGLTRTPAVEARESAAYIDAFSKLIPEQRLGTAQDIANAILFLASPEASYVNGQILYVDGGYTAGNLTVHG